MVTGFLAVSWVDSEFSTSLSLFCQVDVTLGCKDTFIDHTHPKPSKKLTYFLAYANWMNNVNTEDFQGEKMRHHVARLCRPNDVKLCFIGWRMGWVPACASVLKMLCENWSLFDHSPLSYVSFVARFVSFLSRWHNLTRDDATKANFTTKQSVYRYQRSTMTLNLA